ncbi:MAG: DOMON-like domain-containing protein, partial [Chloroflexota bacterium]|nr:DOMON-like domain-containing protein [Chloroflexota bacterium]
MIEQSFSLLPFAMADIPAVTITGQVSLRDQRLIVQYLLAGDIHAVSLAEESANPGRKDELWKHTCFELFLAIKDQPQYWEFNFSPSGDWNVYRIEGYRRIDFREETSIQRVQPEIGRRSDSLSLEVVVDLSSIVQEGEQIKMGVTAVVRTTDGRESY